MYLLYAVLAVVFVGIDALTKYMAASLLKPRHTLPLIENVFHLTYCENTGAAFGIFSGKPYLLAAVSVVIIVAVVVYIIKTKPRSHMVMLSLTMLVSGGAGNVLDRVFRGYVVDFFDFRLINFAIFNVADIFVCLGVGLMAVYVLFFEERQKK